MPHHPSIPIRAIAAALTASLVLSACTSVPAYKQQYVSKPGMTFSDSLVEGEADLLPSQLEPGSQTSGGSQASGCSACR